MRDFLHRYAVGVACAGVLLLAGNVNAQPNPAQLADQIIERNNQILANIESLEITVEPEGAGFFPPSVTRYVKRTVNGNSWLEPVGDDPDSDSGLLSGVFDDQVPVLVSGASHISQESLNGFSVYKVVVDNEELLNELIEDDLEFSESEIHVKRATMWIDSEELVARKIYFEQMDEEGKELNVEILLNDYRKHEGLPIAHSVQFKIEGIASQFTEEDIAEARDAMNQMKEQLSQMPEAQRNAIERQLAPQIEQFEAMIESGEVGGMTLIVTEVKVNN
jgi:hypothetical protein